MRLSAVATLTLLSAAIALPQKQEALGNYYGDVTNDPGIGVGHFSEWSRNTKREFLVDWERGKSSEWTFILGNEGGDLDSMTSALTWAYHLEHSTQNTSDPLKAIALLQTPLDALDLRPENSLALKNSKMTSEHRDLLLLDQLPEDPETLGRKLRGIVLVDHGVPLRRWNGAKVLSIFDHHQDRGAAPDAEPRIFGSTASCTSIVARQMLDELEQLPQEYHMPHELLELILGAIAIDSSGLKKKQSTDIDRDTAQRILARSAWRGKKLKKVMKGLNEELSDAKNSIDHLDVRDLLRRDWKGDLVDTPSPRTPTVSLGFASVPFSMEEQINKTEFKAMFDWFATEAAWTAEIGADISVALNKRKFLDKHGKKQKVREIVLVVRDDVRIGDEQADSLFRTVSAAIENNNFFNVTRWSRADELHGRRMVWVQRDSDAGRKVVRPVVEAAVRSWDMP